MKNKLLSVLLVVVLLCAALCCFAACSGDDLEGSMTIVIDNRSDDAVELVVDLAEGGFKTNDSVLDVLFALADQGKITFSFSGSQYGAFIDSIATVAGEGESSVSIASNAAKGEYVYLYTSVERDKDVTAYASTFTYKERECFSSGVGVSHMHLEEGATVIFTIFVYA